MDIFEAAVLGVVQGLTEFLPVSSSGHLVLAQRILGVNAPGLAFDVFVHLGTLLAVLIAFRGEVAYAVTGFAKGVRKATILRRKDGNSGRWRGAWAEPGFRLAVLVVVGTLPAAAAGLLLRDFFEGLFDSTLAVGAMLLVTGTILRLSEKTSPGVKGTGLAELRTSQSLLVGLGQALAIAPGLSRSGTTISAGLLAGLERDAAARFSFLLSIPAILGASVLEGLELLEALDTGYSLSVISVGTLSAVASGGLAIRLLLRFVKAGRLSVFAYYTWVLGTLVIIGSLV